MPKELIIYCDESDSKGKRFSNFYGGAVIRSSDVEGIDERLKEVKKRLNLHREVKWSRMSSQYLSKYTEFINAYFDLIEKDQIKIRIMFTHNDSRIPDGLTAYHREHEFFLLYYQFFKHAFGLAMYDEGSAAHPTRIRAYFDRLPDTTEKSELFKDHISGLNRWNKFRSSGLFLDRDQLIEIDSAKHVIHQGLDIILGAMSFRLNEKHLEKPEGMNRRGKRTIAKERLYKAINTRIQNIHPGFNIGITTGTGGDIANRWYHSYRHWLFQPKDRK